MSTKTMSSISPCFSLRDKNIRQQDETKQNSGIAKWNIKISKVQFGKILYPFQQDIEGRFFPSIEGEPCCFSIDVLFPSLCGKGKTRQEAKTDWDSQFHVEFQKLYTKCDFERSENEKKLWSIFEKIVDIPAYRALTPLSFQVTGKFVDNPGISKRYRKIEWIDGTKDIVDSRLCPREFVIISPGQYFEATVLRDYHDNRILQVLSIYPVDYQDFTDEEIDSFLNSLPSSKELPDSTRWK